LQTNGGQTKHALGRSQGGFSSVIRGGVSFLILRRWANVDWFLSIVLCLLVYNEMLTRPA
ncbi:MAG: hypothetical protein MUO76_05805, partial [Anaerolineaceae bacterium]|nr:hypothetical protein [Anaerolineaceae bacterium]